MKPGPKPKPTRVHELEGGSKKTHRPLPKDEPQPEKFDKPPPAPRYLCKVGKKKWRERAKILHAAGVLTEFDLDRLASYCVEYATWRKADEEIKEHGEMIKAQSGFPMQSPWMAIRNKSEDKMTKIDAAFGMDPSSRSRVTVKKKEKANPLDEFFKKGKKLEAVK